MSKVTLALNSLVTTVSCLRFAQIGPLSLPQNIPHRTGGGGGGGYDFSAAAAAHHGGGASYPPPDGAPGARGLSQSWNTPSAVSAVRMDGVAKR